MTYLHHFTGLMGCMLLLVAIPLTIIKQPRFSRKLVTLAIFGMMALSILPIYGLVTMAYVRAGLGNLSITSMVLLSLMIASAYTGQLYVTTANRTYIYRSILIGAVIVYPTGLGLTLYDGYALGYNSLFLLLLLAVVTACFIWKQLYPIPFLILAATAAYLAGVSESNNLWDYLLDPWITLVAVIFEVKQLTRAFVIRSQATS
jgi:hypothetical protein